VIFHFCFIRAMLCNWICHVYAYIGILCILLYMPVCVACKPYLLYIFNFKYDRRENITNLVTLVRYLVCLISVNAFHY